MSRKDTFAANLKQLIEASPWSRREVAERAGVSPRTLSRWLQAGLQQPDGRTLAPLNKVCDLLKVSPDDLWRDRRATRADRYAGKLKRLFRYWEGQGVPSHDTAAWIDRLERAVRVARRFRREESDLAEVIRRVKKLPTEGDLQHYLEVMIREWDLDQQMAYRRLIENTQRFLAAALPTDAELLAAWFRETHPARWQNLLRLQRIDSADELSAYVRHMLAEGLSRPEIYEALIRLSND